MIIAPDAEEIISENTEEIRFHDCGANLETIKCQKCQNEIDLDTWEEWLNQFEENSNNNILSNIVLPCCKFETDLNNLIYL